MWWTTRRGKADGSLLFAAGLAVATGLTFWFGLRATREWERSTIQAADRRGNEVVTLLGVALERDMKGGQISVLLKMNEQDFKPIAPYELADRFARGFARFPYLESFFVWTATGKEGADGTTFVFNRADRTPPWDAGGVARDPYPVVFRRDPAAFRSTMQLARAEARRGTRYALFDTSIDGPRYQVIAHLMYDHDGATPTLTSLVGFTVNHEWIQAHYFQDFIQQIQNIIGDSGLSIEILNGDGRAVASVGPPPTTSPTHVRSFPLVFADEALLSDRPSRQRASAWNARVGVANDLSAAAASRGTARTLALLGLGAFATIIGLWITVRAARRAADLATVQSEFVSAVSHEMKTPLSLIRLASDTLARGRYESPAAIADYGRLMDVEARHLTRLIDNVLCYARINDTSSEYDFETLDAAEVVQESIDRFRPQLNSLEFDVQIQLPSDPVTIKADPLMLGQVFDNVIDNAAKYAASGRWLSISVHANGASAHIDIADHGAGIPPQELSRVFDKFYRRKGTPHRGAGLGLAIVRRIVEDHRGTVKISSVVGQGTSIHVELPSSDS